MTTKTQQKINIDVRPRGIASAYVNAPFDEGKQALEKQGYNIISLEENAKLRIQEGKDAYVSRNGNWVKEDVIYVPNKGKFLTRNSPIIENPKKATDCHRKGKDFYLTDEQVEEALADSVLLSLKSVPTNRFGDDDITNYAFGDSAKEYGKFLKDVGINEMPIWTADIQDKAFANQLWFGDLDIRSGLSGYDRDLDYGSGVRGVLNNAEGTQKSFEVHTVDEISKVLNNKGITGKLEKEIIGDLKP
jgi:hypothetical protein